MEISLETVVLWLARDELDREREPERRAEADK